MKISAKIDYACRALLEMCLHWPSKEPLRVSVIAKKQRIPRKFLIHILIQLKQLGLVESVRGKSGGYVLLQAPNQIKLSDVIKNFGGLGCYMADGAKKKDSHVLNSIWEEIDQHLLDAIAQINFETISERSQRKSKAITYDI